MSFQVRSFCILIEVLSQILNIDPSFNISLPKTIYTKRRWFCYEFKTPASNINSNNLVEKLHAHGLQIWLHTRKGYAPALTHLLNVRNKNKCFTYHLKFKKISNNRRLAKNQQFSVKSLPAAWGNSNIWTGLGLLHLWTRETNRSFYYSTLLRGLNLKKGYHYGWQFCPLNPKGEEEGAMPLKGILSLNWRLNCCFPGRSLSLLPAPGDGSQVTG